VEVCAMTDVERALITVNGLLHAGQTSIDDIAAAAGDTRYWPDSLTTHIVIRLANGRIESAAESRFSSLCYAQHLPRPEPQVEVRDETGHVFARVDFAWPELMAFVDDGSLSIGSTAVRVRLSRRPSAHPACRTNSAGVSQGLGTLRRTLTHQITASAGVQG
ncbi:MAG: hypothetical protein ACR2K3_00080, partial [Nocardioides sp.]